MKMAVGILHGCYGTCLSPTISPNLSLDISLILPALLPQSRKHSMCPKNPFEVRLAFAAGLFLIGAAIYYLSTGRIWIRQRWITREETPRLYWLNIGVYLFGGLLLATAMVILGALRDCH